jgi:hypothetical protein
LFDPTQRSTFSHAAPCNGAAHFIAAWEINMAVDIYLKIDGINGESSDAGHKGWIECESVTWHIAQPKIGRRLVKRRAHHRAVHAFQSRH